MTPADLFAYASRFARRHERAGEGTQYPTLRQCAKRFRVTVAEIEQAVDDYQGDGYLGLAVGIGVAGGFAELPRSEWTVEAYAESAA